MKHAFVNIVSKKFMLAAAILATVSFASVNQAQARINHTNNITVSSKSAVEYVGTTASSILFNVKFSNPTADKFTFDILNADGGVLYHQESSEQNFSKKIVVLKQPEDGQLTFIIKGAGTNYAKTFNINTISKVIEDVVVTPVK